VSKAGITPVMMPDLCETALGARHDGRRNL
jgi:hypothetical protein